MTPRLFYRWKLVKFCWFSFLEERKFFSILGNHRSLVRNRGGFLTQLLTLDNAMTRRIDIQNKMASAKDRFGGFLFLQNLFSGSLWAFRGGFLVKISRKFTYLYILLLVSPVKRLFSDPVFFLELLSVVRAFPLANFHGMNGIWKVGWNNGKDFIGSRGILERAWNNGKCIAPLIG